MTVGKQLAIITPETMMTLGLADLEALVEEGLAVANQLMMALAVIKDRKLYKSEASSFEQYAYARFGISLSTAKRHAELGAELLHNTGGLATESAPALSAVVDRPAGESSPRAGHSRSASPKKADGGLSQRAAAERARKRREQQDDDRLDKARNALAAAEEKARAGPVIDVPSAVIGPAATEPDDRELPEVAAPTPAVIPPAELAWAAAKALVCLPADEVAKGLGGDKARKLRDSLAQWIRRFDVATGYRPAAPPKALPQSTKVTTMFKGEH